MMMTTALLYAVLLCAVVGTASCGPRNETIGERCERVRDRLVALEAADGGDPKHAARAGAMRRALGSGFVERCVAVMNESERKCVLDARDGKAGLACTTRLLNAAAASRSKP